jgi:hypothetical protein
MTRPEPQLRPSLVERFPRACAGLATAHLVLVCAFLWTDATAASGGTIDRAVQTYKNAAGILRDYRFFAPAVASDMRAGFFVRTPDGASEFHPFLADNLEVGFRYNCIITSAMRNEKIRDLMAQSWAAVMLGTRPDAEHVTVVAQSFELPTLAQYGAGARPSWKLVYGGTFDRKRRLEVAPAAQGAVLGRAP